MIVKCLNASLMNRPPSEPLDGFQVGMEKVFGKENIIHIRPGIPNFEEKLLELAEKTQPNIIFLQIQSDGIVSPETVRKLSEIAFIIEFGGDKRMESPPQHYLDRGKYTNLMLFSNMDDVSGCRAVGINSEWLEIGYDTTIYKPLPNIPKKYDIVAHMNDYGNQFSNGQFRRDAVKILKQEFGDRFAVFGNFPGAIGNYNHSQIEENLNYNRAKISLSISNFNRPFYSSDRLLRAMASGSVVVAQRFKGIDEMYTLGKHLLSFKNLDDMVAIIKFALASPDVMEKISKEGSEYVKETYSFEKMAENIKRLYYQYHG